MTLHLTSRLFLVAAAKAGVQGQPLRRSPWIPAFGNDE
jgi:hypothetical protein